MADLLRAQFGSFTAGFEPTVGLGRNFPDIGMFASVTTECQSRFHHYGFSGVRRFEATLMAPGIHDGNELRTELGCVHEAATERLYNGCRLGGHAVGDERPTVHIIEILLVILVQVDGEALDGLLQVLGSGWQCRVGRGDVDADRVLDLVYRWNLAGVDRRRLGARGQRSTFHDQAIPNRQTAEQGSCPLVEVWLPNQVLAKIESKPKYCYGFFRGTVKCENDRSARGKWTRGLQSVCVPA